MKQKHSSFNMQIGLWLSAAALLVSASSPLSKLNLLGDNDFFASPEIISSLPYTSTGINTTSYGGGEPQDLALFECHRNAGAHSVWYRYTPTTNESITLDTLGSQVEFDTMIGVFLYESGILTEEACDDDSGGNLKSLVNAALTAGKTYYFVVSSYNGDYVGGNASSGKSDVGPLDGTYDPGGQLVFNVKFNGVLTGAPPSVLSSVRVNPNPTTLDSVDFTVTFSEAVTGVDASDFNLTTTGIIGAAISGVSGSGSTYTVSVNTGSGNGTIRLNVGKNGTIVNAAIYPLGAGFTSGETYRIKRSPIFDDVPFIYWANDYIERLYYAGVTGGCSITPLNYCPDSIVTRAQMAIFLLKGIHGSSYSPPDVGASTGFTDVPVGYWADKWIKQLAAEGITGGCGSGIYCPETTVTRAQMAIFLLKAKYTSVYNPPSATGVFSDVPVGYWADKWIEQLASEGITSGCGVGIYCPDSPVTRAQMAVFLAKAFSLP